MPGIRIASLKADIDAHLLVCQKCDENYDINEAYYGYNEEARLFNREPIMRSYLNRCLALMKYRHQIKGDDGVIYIPASIKLVTRALDNAIRQHIEESNARVNAILNPSTEK